MPTLERSALHARIVELERVRNSRVLVLAASHLDIEMLPTLYECCRELGHPDRLDVVLHGRGGLVNAARRIALLLRGCTERLAFIVPFHCQSAATLLTLCADEIIAGDLALFSPIDPQLNGADGTSFSGLDIKQFGDMATQWFGLAPEAAQEAALGLLSNAVFPPSLTAFWRTTQELAQVADELLCCRGRNQDRDARARIVAQLMTGYHSHNYAITGPELAALGLPVRADDLPAQLAWDISTFVQATVGGAQRDAPDAPWTDALLAAGGQLMLRTRRGGGLAPTWSLSQSG
jgi:hypothetical protein